MAITQATCTSFKEELLEAVHNFSVAGGSDFRAALFRDTASIVGTFGVGTTNYSDMGADEVVGTGYVATGLPLVNAGTSSSGTTGFADFDDLAFTGVTITTRGALIYNDATGEAVAVMDFGSDKVVTADTFTLQFPTPDATSAIIRLA